MIKLSSSIYIYHKEQWDQISYLRINYQEASRMSIQITTDSNVNQQLQISIHDEPYDITIQLTAQELQTVPFRPNKYTAIKLHNQGYKIIIAMSNSENKAMVETLLSKLIYYTKFLKSAIVRQVKNNLCEILIDSFVDILRLKFPSKQMKFQSFKLREFLEGIGMDLGRRIPLEQVRNIVFKSVIYYGLFPIEVMLRYSNYNYITQHIHMFMYDHRTPWSSSLASAIKIGREVYYDNRGGVNINKYFLKLRIVDFFPLDNWVETIADYLMGNLEKFIIGLKQVISYQDRIGNFSSDKLSEPLLGSSNSNSSQQHIHEELIKLFNRHNAVQLYASIANKFYTYYQSQLFTSKVFKRISGVMANALQNQFIFHNPNELVSNMVYILHDGLKKIVEPLTLNTKLKSSLEASVRQLEAIQDVRTLILELNKSDNDKFKLYMKYSTERDVHRYISPIVADELLDFFGIYTDLIAKMFFENLKNVRHHAFSAMWSQFKEINKSDLDVYTKRFQQAQKLWQMGESGHIAIEKKDLKSICSLIMLYMNERSERHKDMCKSVLFWYYNSIRLRNSYKFTKLTSCIGSVIVKDTL